MRNSRPARAKAAPSFHDHELNRELMRFRAADNVTNLRFLGIEYACLAVVIGGVIGFREWRTGVGIPWRWDVPVVALGIVLVGALQHRLAGLGHEAAHYSLLKNKRFNDLVGDIFCMFPILGTIHFYRLFHLAHHQYTNDPKSDPDLVTLGPSKMVDQFPMPRWKFIKSFYLRLLTNPLAFLAYVRDYMEINTLGRSENVYLRRLPEPDGLIRSRSRLALWLGLLYLLALIAGQWALTTMGRPDLLVFEGVLGTCLIVIAARLMPTAAFFRSPFRQPYSGRTSGVLRLTYFTWFVVAAGVLRSATDGRSTFYLWLLWIVPLASSFPYFMLLRDVYQHTNADDGRLTNTRVFFPDPFTRWAVFVYGQDMHVPHHLFPLIPHHRLNLLHQLLKARSPEYAASVVECHGTFANRSGLPTIMDTLMTPRQGAAEAPSPACPPPPIAEG